ncbi:fumarate hydratase [Falsigemmobacter intermedius]|uniref:Fumarate hydratase n=1 Tax=Falsigemmobacter intermedius TaxID=1553448 RepID=A0A444MB99_9RHOB|nr:fumarate hydratase [Falsigemmobacter intermedius]RWY40971.1 fumarate hydratase [Falsigemmobacter intermedius]
MSLGEEDIREVSKALYSRCLRAVPEDTRAALRHAMATESSETGRKTLDLMLRSAELAARKDRFVCSDAGVPVYFVRIGTRCDWRANIKSAIRQGFDELVREIDPPILQHVTNPLTLERGYHGKDMPIVTFDLIEDADYIEITCSPKALGSGRWAALELFTFPTLETIETWVLDVAIKAGAQHCPPVIMGVGIGGTFDYAAKMAKEATLRPVGQPHPEPMVAGIEERLFRAVNGLGYGPMGTGGDSTVLGVHVNYAAGHGFTPVAVAFNCWINRRATARLRAGQPVEWLPI